MNLFIAALIGGFIAAINSIIGKILLYLGIGIIAYSGMNALFNTAKSYITGGLSSAGGQIAGFLGFMQVDVAFSMILSAISIRMLMKLGNSSTLKGYGMLANLKAGL